MKCRTVVPLLIAAFARVAVHATAIAADGDAARCADTDGTPGLTQIRSTGWGLTSATRASAGPRTRPFERPTSASLKLKWSYNLGDNSPRSMPLVTEDTLFIGDGNGLVALDRETGCQRWRFAHPGQVRSAIVHERTADGATLFFLESTSGVFAVNAGDGTLLWNAHPDGVNEAPLYSGTPLVTGGTVFVPVASQEIGLATVPFLGCCHTAGGLGALDSQSGATRWYRRTIEQPAEVTGRRWLVVKQRGPSGAPAWGAPAFDEKRNLVYFGTGQNYSHPTTETSDAIFAVEADTGAVRWVMQATSGDAYNMACNLMGTAHPNCPNPVGPDLDFGAPPILATMERGEDLVLAGQKSGDIHALRADDGSVVWQRKLGRGGALGGIHWGIAYHAGRGLVLVPVSDLPAGPLTGPGEAQPGLHAVRVQDGSRVWFHERQSRCNERACWGGISAAISIANDVVFAGSIDGFLEAIHVESGDVLWSFDTWRDFEAVNDTATGGAFDAHGPMIADDLVIVSSGYGSFFQRGGNALLVFALEASDGAPTGGVESPQEHAEGEP
ncbi:MAG: PQQ-binding-like beta-propeller repeat protein [Gammaproteobacteria bacterium]|nr:PQQ-binding-like beta-propeller repeat protein [Gammaproteobacteria bacterium]